MTVLLGTGAAGPPIIKRPLGGTLEVMDAIINHKWPGSPNSLVLVVDVRDIAAAAVKVREVLG